jgi:hypothetical protein
MTYTKENIVELLTNLQKLNELVNEFINDDFCRSVKIESDGIYHEVNTSCNCHPEYDWDKLYDWDKFIEWYDEKLKKT